MSCEINRSYIDFPLPSAKAQLKTKCQFNPRLSFSGYRDTGVSPLFPPYELTKINSINWEEKKALKCIWP